MPHRRRRHPRSAFALLLATGLLLAACGGQPSAVEWRNVTVPVPEGWFVVEEAATHLSLANTDLSPEEVFGGPAPDEDAESREVVGMFFTYEPTTLPGDWLQYVEDQGATLESNDQIWLDDDEVPATRIVFSYESAGIPTREMVVVIPSRGIVVLNQPIPAPGDEDAPEVFLRHVDTFVEVLQSSSFGAPLLD